MKLSLALLLLTTGFTVANGALRGQNLRDKAPNANNEAHKLHGHMLSDENLGAPSAEDDFNGDYQMPIANSTDKGSNDAVKDDNARMLATGDCGIFAEDNYFHPEAGSCHNLGGDYWNDRITWIRASTDTCIEVWEHHEGGRYQKYCESDWIELQELSQEVSRVCCSGTGGGGQRKHVVEYIIVFDEEASNRGWGENEANAIVSNLNEAFANFDVEFNLLNVLYRNIQGTDDGSMLDEFHDVMDGESLQFDTATLISGKDGASGLANVVPDLCHGGLSMTRIVFDNLEDTKKFMRHEVRAGTPIKLEERRMLVANFW